MNGFWFSILSLIHIIDCIQKQRSGDRFVKIEAKLLHSVNWNDETNTQQCFVLLKSAHPVPQWSLSAKFVDCSAHTTTTVYYQAITPQWVTIKLTDVQYFYIIYKINQSISASYIVSGVDLFNDLVNTLHLRNRWTLSGILFLALQEGFWISQ